jgi:hypothetical protein
LETKEKGGFVVLTPAQHKMRKLNALILKVPPKTLERLSGPDIE